MPKTALITGASGGIGYELAAIYAKEKYNLALVARNLDKLTQIKQELQQKYGVEVLLLPADLSVVGLADEVFKAVEKENIVVDVLINNAGVGDYGKFACSDWKRQEQMIQLNLISLTQLTHLFLPKMLERKSGKILNVASVASFLPGPLMSVYYATKAYVLSFSESLANEVLGSGVTVSVLCPGPTKSGFQKVAYREDSKVVERNHLPTSQEVAQFGYNALESGRVVATHGLSNKLIVQSTRFLPRSFVRQIVRWVQERKK